MIPGAPLLLDLSSAAAVAEIIGAGTVLGGAIFAGYQIHAMRIQRHDLAVTSALQSFFPVDAMADVDLVYALPDAAEPDTVRADEDLLRAANRIYVFAEYLGFLVYQRSTSLERADLLAGGMILTTWNKLEPWIRLKREQSESQTPGEWYEWLVDQLRKHGRGLERGGVHETLSVWRP